jgi:hypothetical protein
MKSRMLAVGTLALAAVLPGAAFADRDDGRCDEIGGRRVWVEGRYEDRETRRVVPAITRDEWVPERREVVVVPAVTQEFRVPAVVERVYVPTVVERTWVPEVRERVYVPGRIEVRFDHHGVDFRGSTDGGYEDRVVRRGHWEDRCTTPAHYEDRVVTPERCETRIVVPERREVRVEPAHMRTVVVCAERVEVTRERVWIPGHVEERRDLRRD